MNERHVALMLDDIRVVAINPAKQEPLPSLQPEDPGDLPRDRAREPDLASEALGFDSAPDPGN